MTQLAFSPKHFDTTKMASFYANFERESNLLNFRQSEVLTDAAEKQIKTLRIVHNNIMRMQQHFFKYVNKKRKTAPLLKKRDKVYLLTKNLKTKKSSKKLDHVKGTRVFPVYRCWNQRTQTRLYRKHFTSNSMRRNYTR